MNPLDYTITEFKRCIDKTDKERYERFVVVMHGLLHVPVRCVSTGLWFCDVIYAVKGQHVTNFMNGILNEQYSILIKEEQWKKYKEETILIFAKINLMEGVLMPDIMIHMKTLF